MKIIEKIQDKVSQYHYMYIMVYIIYWAFNYMVMVIPIQYVNTLPPVLFMFKVKGFILINSLFTLLYFGLLYIEHKIGDEFEI